MLNLFRDADINPTCRETVSASSRPHKCDSARYHLLQCEHRVELAVAEGRTGGERVSGRPRARRSRPTHRAFSAKFMRGYAMGMPSWTTSCLTCRGRRAMAAKTRS